MGQSENKSADEDRVPRMRQAWREITESDNGECQMMSDYRWACDEIERLRRQLREMSDAAAEAAKRAGVQMHPRVAEAREKNRGRR